MSFSQHDKQFRIPAFIQLFIGVIMDYVLSLLDKGSFINFNLSGKEAHLPTYTVSCIAIFILLQAAPTLIKFLGKRLGAEIPDKPELPEGNSK